MELAKTVSQAFTDFGIERLIELTQIYKDNPELLKRWPQEYPTEPGPTPDSYSLSEAITI